MRGVAERLLFVVVAAAVIALKLATGASLSRWLESRGWLDVVFLVCLRRPRAAAGCGPGAAVVHPPADPAPRWYIRLRTWRRPTKLSSKDC